MSSSDRGVVDWLFRDRESGRLVVGQWPNAAIGVWALCAAARLADLPADAEDTLRWVGAGALLVWAVDEVARGANPFRRILGGVVLAFQVVALTRALTG